MAIIARGQTTLTIVEDGRYHAAEWALSTSPTVPPTTGWRDTPYAETTGSYQWERNGLVIPPATKPASWSAPHRNSPVDGEKGEQGVPAVIYDLLPEHASITKSTLGVFTPNKTSCRIKLTVGGETEIVGVDAPIDYEGRNIIEYNKFTGNSATVTVTNGIIKGVSNNISGKSYPRIWNACLANRFFDIQSKYKISFYARANANATRYYMIADTTAKNPILNAIYCDFTTEWVKYEHTFTPLRPQATANSAFFVYCGETTAIDTTSWLEIKEVILTKGTSTDFNLSPEEAIITFNNSSYTPGTNVNIPFAVNPLKWSLSHNNKVIGTETIPIISDASDMIITGRNLLLDTREYLFENSGAKAYYFTTYLPREPIEPNKDYLFTSSVTVLAGAPTHVTIAFYNNASNVYGGMVDIPIIDGEVSGVIRTTDSANAVQFFIYNGKYGATANNQIKLTRFKLAKGNKDSGWDEGEDTSLQSAKTKAITDNFTTAEGGLLLTSFIEIGEWVNKEQLNPKLIINGLAKNPEDELLIIGDNPATLTKYLLDGTVSMFGGKLGVNEKGQTFGNFGTISINNVDYTDLMNGLNSSFDFSDNLLVAVKKEMSVNGEIHAKDFIITRPDGSTGGVGSIIIDDTAIAGDKTWSSAKVKNQLDTKSNTSHTHSYSSTTHTHNFTNILNIPWAITTTSLVPGTTGITGSSSTIARQDHTHTLPSYPTLNSLKGAKSDLLNTVNLDTVNTNGIYTQTANANSTIANKYPIQEAGTLFSGVAAYNSANQIYGSFNTNRWFVRGGGNSSVTKTGWKEIAFTNDLTPQRVGAEPAFNKNSAFNRNFGQNAGTVCQGNDARLSNARPASDVSPWAKEFGKPYYSYKEITNRPYVATCETKNPDQTDVPLPGSYGCMISTEGIGTMQLYQPHRQGKDPKLYFRSGFDGLNRFSDWAQVWSDQNLPIRKVENNVIFVKDIVATGI